MLDSNLGQINTNCVSFISLTVTVKHVVGGRNKQVLPQWICLRCNIQSDNMGSVIFFECGLPIFCCRKIGGPNVGI